MDLTEASAINPARRCQPLDDEVCYHEPTDRSMLAALPASVREAYGIDIH